MYNTAHLLATARRAAGLSQHELAERAGTSQPAVARLERGLANPTVATLERLLAAAGFRLECRIAPLDAEDPVVAAYKRDVDRTLLRENLRRSIDERLRLNEDVRELGAALRRAVAERPSP